MQLLFTFIWVGRETRKKIRELGLKHNSFSLLNVPVTTVETVVHMGDSLLKELDIVAVNIHPFYSNPDKKSSVPNAESALNEFLGAYDLVRKKAATIQKKVVVSEIGWPTNSEPGEANQGSVPMAKEFLELFTAYARQSDVQYFWFELYDSVWKRSEFPNRSMNFSEFHLGLIEEDHITSKGLVGEFELESYQQSPW